MKNCFSQLGTTHFMSSTAFCPNLKMSIIIYGNAHIISHYLLMSTLSWNKTLYIECYSRTFIEWVFFIILCIFSTVFFFCFMLSCMRLSHSIKEPAAAAHAKKTRWSISVLPRYSGYTWGAHELLLTHRHSENILADLVDSTDMNG